jgi:hypothetical protein
MFVRRHAAGCGTAAPASTMGAMTDRILSEYLAEIARIRATRAGTGEVSYYGAMAGALNAAGERLAPRVFCVPNLRNSGAGFPDLGLFVAGGAAPPPDWPEGAAPERGVVEIDDIPADIGVKLQSRQVKLYLAKYGLVLVTNYRDFALLGRDAQGQAERREAFSFGCADAASFFALARSTRRPAGLAARFAEFLARVLLHQAPLARPEDVAFFLASYARDALARVGEHATLPAFADLRGALQEALGMTFEDARGEHLFRSTLVQTLFYGLFSAWVETARDGAAAFDWRAAGWSLHVPFVATLFQRIATPEFLKPLGLEEPLSWAAGALNRVDRGAFFARFEEAEAVRYFYEPFLAAYDPELRRELGVWYTPREIVRYMVERVDRVLRSELGVADGLADPSVWVLDPCCGTGAYLVEVLDRIARTLRVRGDDALIGEDLKATATTRVAGFEIMPAPYVIAHWQIGHALRAAGAPLAQDQRAAVYLTNALTGWAAPAEDAAAEGAQRRLRLSFPPLADERDEAARVKQVRPILVVLGNPPYNAFAGTSPAEEAGLVEPYKEGLRRDWGIRKFNLDDLYVRFFRVAERRIAEGTGRGVVCFISNHSWLSGASYVVMRRRLLAEFDRIWIDNLHGDRKISERGPDGRTSETVFAIRGFSPGIQQGTAISLLVRRAPRASMPAVFFDDTINESDAGERRAHLLASVASDAPRGYVSVFPAAGNRHRLRPGEATAEYATWPKLPELAAIAPLNGLMEKRGGALIDDDRVALERRMRAYFDASRSWEDVRAEIGGLGRDAASFDAAGIRRRVTGCARFDGARIVRYFLRPFDLRWAYATTDGPVWNRSRPDLQEAAKDAAWFFATRPGTSAVPEGAPMAWTALLGDDHALRTDAYYIPVFRRDVDATRANLSAAARTWLAALGLPDPDANREVAVLPWHHALAIGYAPAWLADNADGIRQDWPRIPLPVSAKLLRASAALGARIAALLDPDVPVAGVTAGTIAPALQTVAVPAMLGGGAMTEQDRFVTAGWGHAGREGVVMPGRGRIATRFYADDEAAMAATADLLGARTHDIFLNGAAYWRNVPEAVWDFHIGGYQVMKKWLSYREQRLLGRALTPAEVRHVRDTARRLAALVLLWPDLDANYRACAAAPHDLNARSSGGGTVAGG